MFELAVAYKYLIPRWRQLSVSIISIISILVIALVVWLILVFFSVTDGLEKRWIEKLISITAPVRLTPSPAYYQSYYHRIDSVSSASDYTYKSINEKRLSASSDPYDPHTDQEIPSDWLPADKNADGSLKDLVKEAFSAAAALGSRFGVRAEDYEMTVSNMRLRLIRENDRAAKGQSFLSQTSYLTSFDPNNIALQKTLIPLTSRDLSNLLQLIPLNADSVRENNADPILALPSKEFQAKLHSFFDALEVKSLRVRTPLWSLPHSLIPSDNTFNAIALIQDSTIRKVIIPAATESIALLEQQLALQGLTCQRGRLSFSQSTPYWEKKQALPPSVPLLISGIATLPAKLADMSLETAKELEDLRFHVSLSLQGVDLGGEIPFRQVDIATAEVISRFAVSPLHPPFWAYQVTQPPAQMILPSDPLVGDGILLTKNFRDSGVLLGDRGYLSYYAMTPSSVQEQQIPIYVAGFYDPGIIPTGGRLVTVSKEITSLIRSVQQAPEGAFDHGINIRFDDVSQADAVKAALVAELRQRGIDPYWKVETFREYEFTKDLIQQLRSDKNLFSLISLIIIVVACSNIISMLIILVNDKKVEIGILRSMGATSLSIGIIFGTCGIVMGLMGSLIGAAVAALTLQHLDQLLGFIGAIQGFEVLNTSFYGATIPQELSYHALSFVFGTTVIISLLAGLIPAIKASLLRPSAVLRSE